MMEGSSSESDAFDGALEAIQEDAALVQDVAQEERKSQRIETRKKILKRALVSEEVREVMIAQFSVAFPCTANEWKWIQSHIKWVKFQCVKCYTQFIWAYSVPGDY